LWGKVRGHWTPTGGNLESNGSHKRFFKQAAGEGIQKGRGENGGGIWRKWGQKVWGGNFQRKGDEPVRFLVLVGEKGGIRAL